jgi:hypothetical protein
MHVFIDESSTFIPDTGMGTLCSLTVPSKSVGPLKRKIAFLTQSWPRVSGELKGGQITFSQLKALVELLYQYDALLHCCAIDVALESQQQISEHKQKQCEGITKYLVPTHLETYRNEVWGLRHKLEKMPNQLYLQCILLSALVWSTAENATLYFSQRRPKELGEFKWLVDAKDPKKISTQEMWWRDTLGALSESRGREKPFSIFRQVGFNYTYFDRSFAFEKDMWLPDAPRENVKGIDVKKLISDNVHFIDSKTDLLIQVIDILAGYLRRVLSKEIADPEVVKCLGRLQILRKRDKSFQSVELLSLSVDPWKDKVLAHTLRLMTNQARPMLLRELK